jgi:peptide/nickel transport system substrate-binding protein
MKRLTKTATITTALAVALSLAACGSSGNSGGTGSGNSGGGNTSGTPHRGGTMVFDISSYPQDMNPYSATADNISIAVFGAWWEFLVRPNENGTGYQPRLASSYTVTPDNKTYTFKIRQGVKFSDGTPMTTADVLFSLHRAFTDANSQIAFVGQKLASMNAPDPQTVVIKFKQPWPYLLADLSGFNAAILPKALIKREGYAAFLKHPVGTGPFMWASSSPGVSITVTRNPHYWEKGRPYLNSIDFHVVPADTARATAVVGGQATLAEGPPLNQLASLKANPAVKTYVFPSTLVELVPLNVTKPPLNNEKVREAISLAIDRPGIVKAGLFGYGTPASTFLVGPPGQTFQNTSLNLYPFNLAKAKQLLQQSGVPLPVHLQFGVSQGVAQQAISTVMQSDLAKIGIQLSVLQRDFVSNENALDSGNFTMNTTFWGNFIGDPSEQPLFWMDPAFCCKSYFTGFNDPASIALVHQAVDANTAAAARPLFDQVQQKVAQTAHAIPLYFPKLTYVASPNLVGFEANPYGTYPFEQFSLSG